MSEKKPRFQITKLEGTGVRKIATPSFRKDEKGKPILNKDGEKILLGGFDYEDREVDAGWNIYFPSGSSIHIWTQEEMERQGFLDAPDNVDMETGEVEPSPVYDYEAKAQQVSNRTRNSRAAQTG